MCVSNITFFLRVWCDVNLVQLSSLLSTIIIPHSVMFFFKWIHVYSIRRENMYAENAEYRMLMMSAGRESHSEMLLLCVRAPQTRKLDSLKGDAKQGGHASPLPSPSDWLPVSVLGRQFPASEISCIVFAFAKNLLCASERIGRAFDMHFTSIFIVQNATKNKK